MSNKYVVSIVAILFTMRIGSKSMRCLPI